MGIAKNVKNLKPGNAEWNDHAGGGRYAVYHKADPSTGVGAYGWTADNGASGGIPYGDGLLTQRDAVAHVSKRIRSVMNNRSKDQRRRL